MPNKSTRKTFDIIEEVEKIKQEHFTRQPHKESINLIQSQFINRFRMPRYTNLSPYFASAIWRELLMKTRQISRTEFRDDVSELRREIDTLKLTVKSLTKGIESSNKTIDELSNEIRQKKTIRGTGKTLVDKLCNTYVDMVRKIEIVKKVYVIDTNSGLLCWTIVDAEPFDSTVLEPIYDAQVKIYKEIREDLVLDFHVLNLSELLDRQELESILSPSAKLVWQR